MAAQQQPPPSDQQRARAAQLAGIIAGAYTASAAAGGTGAAVGGVGTLTAAALALMLRRLTRTMVRWRYQTVTIRFVLRTATRVVRTPPAATGPAELANALAERTFAAWFLERSAERIEAAVAEARAAGGDVGEAAQKAADAETRYVDQHLDAQGRRRDAAAAVDTQAGKPGQLDVTPADAAGDAPPRVVLAWKAHADDRVTPECKAADGTWFYADTPPLIGFPGMPHGGTCRCVPATCTEATFLHGKSTDEATTGVLDVGHRPHPAADTGDETGTAAA